MEDHQRAAVRGVQVAKSGTIHSWWAIAFAVMAAAAAHTALVVLRVTPVLDGELWGPDAYMHLAWAKHLLAEGGWYERVFPRINAPYGAELHFSRLFDLVVLAGAGVGGLFADFDRALHGWGVIMGPVLHVLVLLLLSWGTRPLLSDKGFLAAALLLSLQRPALDHFMAGRPDHHGLLLLMVLAVLALMLRALSSASGTRLMALAGVVSGLALWTLVEGLLIVVVVAPAWGLLWVWRRDRFAHELLVYAGAFTATAVAATALQLPPARWGVAEYNTISIAHVALGLALAVVAGVLVATERLALAGTAPRRAAIGASAGLAAAAAMALLFPPFLRGFSPTVDPAVARVLAVISESYSLLPVDPASTFLFTLNIGPALICLPVAALGLARGAAPERSAHLVMLVALVVFVPYGVYSMRGTGFAHLALILPWTLAARGLYRWLRGARGEAARGAAAALAAALLLFVNWLVAIPLARAYELDVGWRSQSACPYREVAPHLGELASGRAEAIVLADLFAGSEIIYRTSLSVVGAPYHLNVAGIKDTFRIFGARDPRQAREILVRRRVDFVLLCQSATPAQVRALRSRPRPRSFIATLVLDEPPSWLERLTLPPALDERWLLFRRAP